jgi:hypothetical protein
MRTYLDACLDDFRMMRRGEYTRRVAGLCFAVRLFLGAALARLRGWAEHAQHGGPFRYRDPIW